MSIIKGYDTVVNLSTQSIFYNNIKQDSWHTQHFFICRYLTNNPSGNVDKKMTTAEVELLCKDGIDVVSIFETTFINPDLDINSNLSRGYNDALSAITAASNLGQPSNTPIYFAVEYAENYYNPIPDKVSNSAQYYLSGVNSVLTNTTQNSNNYRMGVYAPGYLCSSILTWFPSSPIMRGNPDDPNNIFLGYSIKQDPNPDDYSGSLGNSVDYDTADSTTYGGWHNHYYPAAWTDNNDQNHCRKCFGCSHFVYEAHQYTNAWENYNRQFHRRKCTKCSHYSYDAHHPDSNGVCVQCGRSGLPTPLVSGGETDA